ncbi:unnamed protein product [Auanema sp. JU1783]|nr:unnamed protein product [Auanema sp. JU1783]
MQEGTDIPGSSSFIEPSLINASMSEIRIDQVELDEEDVGNTNASDENLLDHLTENPYYVFVLSETGRPIFMSSGMEDQWCGLFALIGVFVTRIEHFDDSLHTISDGEIHVYFCHKKPLILCIVSRSEEQLDMQLNALFDQILSTLSRSQLETVYHKRGDNYDLRRLLKGTDKYMESCVWSWREDVALLQSAIRVIPMQPSDRDFLSSTMATQIAAAKLDGVLFGLVLAHRQVVTMVRYKKYTMHPRDIHILINLVSGNTSLQLPEAQIWTPICLPKFNDTGFFYGYITYPWENNPACLVLLSVKRDHFEALNEVKKKIVEKLEGNTKFFTNFQASLELPIPFEISKIGSSHELMWSFVYKNKSSRQICISSAKVPVISKDERREIKKLVDKMAHFCRNEKTLRCLYVKRKSDNVLLWATEKFNLQCVFSPFTGPQTATMLIDRLLKTLKSHEQRYFIIHSTSF